MLFETVQRQLSQWRDVVRAHRDPDQPPVLGWQIPYLGCGLQFGRNGPEWLRAQARRLASPFTLYVLGRRITFAQDPAYVKTFYTAGVEEVSMLAGLAAFPAIAELIPLNSTGPEGANVAMATLKHYLASKVTEAGEMLDAEAGLALREALVTGRGDLLPVLRRAILRLTALLLAGPRLAHMPDFVDAVCELDEISLRVVKNPLARATVRAGLVIRARVVAYFVDELRRRRATPSPPGTEDLCDALLAARDPQGAPFSDENLAQEMLGYIFATSANTPAAAAICALHILHDPALRRRIDEEQEATRAAHGETISFAALKAMPLLQATYLETLRMYIGPMHLRMAMHPMTIGPYTVPARSLIGFSVYILQRDPDVYTDPDVFDPDRFLAGPRGPASSPSSAHFLPYGRGVHTCLGRNLARQEIMLTVARLLRDFQVELAPCKQPLAVDFLTNGVAAPAGPRIIRVAPRQGVGTAAASGA